ncbi:MAG TPA: hypothetical protein VGF30_01485 [Bacteroidia bacterium]
MLLSTSLFGQTTCTKDKIYGKWVTLKRDVDMDIINRIKNGTEVLTPLAGFITFGEDGKCVSVSEYSKRPTTRRFRIYENECLIVWGMFRKPTRENTCKILYLDEKYMIISFPNPKTEIPCLLVRQ